MLAAGLLALWSVPAALAVQLALLVLARVDAGRAPPLSVSRQSAVSPVLNAIGPVRIEIRTAAARVRIADDVGPGIERLPPIDGSPDASADGGTELVGSSAPLTASYRIAFRRRGTVELGDTHVRALGPWGLAWKEQAFATRETFRIQPGLEELRKERLPGLRPTLASPGARRLRRWGDGSEFESLREYRRGDDPRTVDWKASARRAELLVRNYQVERNQNVVLAIDGGRLMREWIGDRERLDFALAGALLVAERARSYGDRVGVIVFDEEVRHLSPARRVRLQDLADTFAGVEARLVEPNYPRAFAMLGRSFRKRSLVLLFSDVIDSAASSALMAGMITASARHLPVVVALRNPDVNEVAARVGGEPSSPYRRAAAEALLEARSRALTTMRRAGVQTVDVLAGDAPLAVLERYVEIKRSGLL